MSGTNRNQTSDVLFGDSLMRFAPKKNIPNPRCFLSGFDASSNRVAIPFNEETLGRHLMLLGGSGTGKTNALCQIIRQLRDTMRGDEVMILFDTKGDFYREFYRPGDIVISNDKTATDTRVGCGKGRVCHNVQTDVLHAAQRACAAQRSAHAHFERDLLIGGPLYIHILIVCAEFGDFGTRSTGVRRNDRNACFIQALRYRFVT